MNHQHIIPYNYTFIDNIIKKYPKLTKTIKDLIKKTRYYEIKKDNTLIFELML